MVPAVEGHRAICFAFAIARAPASMAPHPTTDAATPVAMRATSVTLPPHA